MAYTTVKGDTLGKIARDNNMTLDQLLDLNPDYKKNPNMVGIGATIKLSDGDEGGGTDDTKKDYTDDKDTRFFGLPGEPEIWKKGDTWFAVYNIPGADIPILFEISSKEDLAAFFGEDTPIADRDVTDDIIQKSGGMVFGSTDNIPATEGDPWAGFLQRMDRAAETQPWLEDPDVFEVHAGAWLEGREVEKWELEGTDWWQEQNEAQRDWAWTVMRDPTEAARRMEDRTLGIGDSFRMLGMDVGDDVVNHIATRWETGEWSADYAETQISALAGGGASAYTLDASLQGKWTGISGTTFGSQDVRDKFSQWLGPLFGKVTDIQANIWATKIREDGDVAQEELTRHLQQMRMAVLPEYTDPSMSYAEIAQPWLNFGTSIWGQQLDETSDMFIELLRTNDSTEAGKLLRREGLKQNIGKVETSRAQLALGPTGGVRKAET
jgi:hypothetical protein